MNIENKMRNYELRKGLTGVQKIMPALKIRENIKNIPITMGYILEKIYHTFANKPEINGLNVNHDRKLVFMHVPKTAGTSIKTRPLHKSTKNYQFGKITSI